MKYLHVLAIIILACSSSPKKETEILGYSPSLKEDSLINYSYMVNGEENGKPFSSGTGFFIMYNKKCYLVTNYHVISGIDPYTGKLTNEKTAINSSIFIVFRPRNENLLYYPMKYPLYDNKGNRNYHLFKYDNDFLDIAVMPIILPTDGLIYNFKETDLDTSTNYKSDDNLMMFGFANGKFINHWQPTKISMKSIAAVPPDPVELYFDNPSIKGMSGSPVFRKSSTNEIKLVSINFRMTGFDKRYPNIKGSSILIKYVFDLIKHLDDIKKEPIKGLFYSSK